MVKLKCRDQNEKKNQNIRTKSAFMPNNYINVCGSVFPFLAVAMLYLLSGYSNLSFSFFNKNLL